MLYIKEVLVPNLWSGACVVMDNFSFHKVAGVKEAIEEVGAHLIYLSPYSPDFSPIENCWSKIKEFLRSLAARTYEDLDKAITEAFESINLSDILGWFKPQRLLYVTQLRTAIAVLAAKVKNCLVL
ncbi:transposase [Brasilonema sp. CT11]|nr:transposase [Brasilonema sp. CT11]